MSYTGNVTESLFPEYGLKIESFEVSPALKWAGGKRWLLPQLKPIWQPFADRRLVEPFVGGMGIALGLNPASALLSDINEHLINFYQWLKAGLFIEADMLNEEAAFYAARARFNELVRAGQLNSKEAAGLFYYLNRTCFNGLCRFNSKNEFNVPFGRYKKINYTRDFTHYTNTLRRWDIQRHSFETTALGEQDFLYIDPPYDTPFTQYSKEDFAWADQEKLARWLCQTDAPMVVTNQATPRVLELYADLGFTIKTLLAPRRIASSGDRTPALEMLATKNI
ncbi:Dam family site-specific DNA-(adenine-N6)-methyltransferase [Hymenobacter sp.]|uniref:DNA adenine methylase n=1 Tax=Hymenobacter sp. TaxID=1898978 RepID=UPI00286A3DCB|nr:Dam family site-specific DNA-(adenine-N6)-methyltransferase [Hymenobacter sp.]